MKRRILSLLLTAAMLLGMLPGAALATASGDTTEEIVYFSYAHDAWIWATGNIWHMCL